MCFSKVGLGLMFFLLVVETEFTLAKRQLPLGNTSVQCHSERWGQLCPNGCLLCNIKFLVTGGARKDIAVASAHLKSTALEFIQEDACIKRNDAIVKRHKAQTWQKLEHVNNETSLCLSLSDSLQDSHTQIESELETLKTGFRRINGRLERIERNLAKKSATCSTGATTTQSSCTLPVLSGRDCAEIYRAGGRRSGVYVIKPQGAVQPIRVICDMDDNGGGWTVIQRRSDGSLNFDRTWREYKRGFKQENCQEIREMWIGNENLHRLTHQANQQLKVVLTSSRNETRYARYRHFQIDNEASGYRMVAVDGYRSDTSGDVGDAFREFPNVSGQRRQLDHLGARFTTRDVDNDDYVTNCAAGGNGGWWYRSCAAVNLNGEWQDSNPQPHQQNTRGLNGHEGIIWRPWTDRHGSLKATMMKIRPTRY